MLLLLTVLGLTVMTSKYIEGVSKSRRAYKARTQLLSSPSLLLSHHHAECIKGYSGVLHKRVEGSNGKKWRERQGQGSYISSRQRKGMLDKT